MMSHSRYDDYRGADTRPAPLEQEPLAKYPKLQDLVDLLKRYFRVLATYRTAKSATIKAAEKAYLDNLANLDREYTWDAVLNYHLAFFHCRLWDMKGGDYDGWMTTDADLQLKHLSGRLKPLAAPRA